MNDPDDVATDLTADAPHPSSHPLHFLLLPSSPSVSHPDQQLGTGPLFPSGLKDASKNSSLTLISDCRSFHQLLLLSDFLLLPFRVSCSGDSLSMCQRRGK
jgi:hypothetical protein